MAGMYAHEHDLVRRAMAKADEDMTTVAGPATGIPVDVALAARCGTLAQMVRELAGIIGRLDDGDSDLKV